MPNQKETARLLAKIKASQLGKDANGNLVSKRPDLEAENELLSHLGANVDDDSDLIVGEGFKFKEGGLFNDEAKLAINYDDRKARYLLKAILAKQVGSEFHQKTNWDKMVDMKQVPRTSDENKNKDSSFTIFDMTDPMDNLTNPLNPIYQMNNKSR